MKPRRAFPHLSLLFVALWLAACGSSGSRAPLPAATVVNPETFPQPLPPTIAEVAEKIPPPVTENSTFVMVDGVPNYKIGPGDLLEVFLTRGVTQEKYQVPVRASGRIAVNLVEVNVDGLTAEQAAQALASELSVYFRSPVVDVQVKEHNSKRVLILGTISQLGRGALLPLRGRTTLLEAIAQSGGFGPTARLEQIRITRGATQTYTVNMYRTLEHGDPTREVVLDAGDVIFVPERTKEEDTRVFLLGEVKTPGPVAFRPGLTMSQLLAQAGGWKEEALFEEARIIRPDPQNPEIIGINLGRLMLDGDRRIEQFLRPNDLVYIPRTPIGNWNAFLNKLRPTLEFLALPLQPVFTIKALGD